MFGLGGRKRARRRRMKVGRGLDFGLTFMVLLFNCSDLYIMGTITCIYVVFGISSLDVSCGCQSD